MSDLSVDELIDRLDILKLRDSAVKAELKSVNNQILEKLWEAGATSLTTPGGRLVTRVEASRKIWDVQVLKDILEPIGLWDQVKVVKEDFDQDRLLHLVDGGRVPEDELTPAFEVKPSAPYPRVTPANAKRAKTH